MKQQLIEDTQQTKTGFRKYGLLGGAVVACASVGGYLYHGQQTTQVALNREDVDGVDAALHSTCNEAMYFFRDGEYHKIPDGDAGNAVGGYPKNV